MYAWSSQSQAVAGAHVMANNAAQSDAYRSALTAPTPSAPGRERSAAYFVE